MCFKFLNNFYPKYFSFWEVFVEVLSLIKVYIRVKHLVVRHILMKLVFSRLTFEKYSNMKFKENSSSWSRVVPCGQTWRSWKSLFSVLQTPLHMYGRRNVSMHVNTGSLKWSPPNCILFGKYVSEYYTTIFFLYPTMFLLQYFSRKILTFVSYLHWN